MQRCIHSFTSKEKENFLTLFFFIRFEMLKLSVNHINCLLLCAIMVYILQAMFRIVYTYKYKIYVNKHVYLCTHCLKFDYMKGCDSCHFQLKFQYVQIVRTHICIAYRLCLRLTTLYTMHPPFMILRLRVY